VNVTGLLSFMLGATDTTKGPDVAPPGIVMLIDVAPHVLTVTPAPFSRTTLFPCDAPNPVPEITTWLPIDPFVADTLLITGAGADAELIDTLSKAAVANAEVLPLVTAKPTFTLCAIVIVWLAPSCVQFTPSDDV
jgi:hypothetical protein